MIIIQQDKCVVGNKNRYHNMFTEVINDEKLSYNRKKQYHNLYRDRGCIFKSVKY